MKVNKSSLHIELLREKLLSTINLPGTNIIMMSAGHSQSSSGNSPLSLKGHHQAHNLSTCLQPLLKQFKGFLSSDLQKCHQTAMLALDYPSDVHLIKVLRSLREIDLGTYSLQEDTQLETGCEAEGGESLQMVKERVSSSLLKYCQSNGTYLVFTHPIVMHIFSSHLPSPSHSSHIPSPSHPYQPDCSLMAFKATTQQQYLLPQQSLFNWDYNHHL